MYFHFDIPFFFLSLSFVFNLIYSIKTPIDRFSYQRRLEKIIAIIGVQVVYIIISLDSVGWGDFCLTTNRNLLTLHFPLHIFSAINKQKIMLRRKRGGKTKKKKLREHSKKKNSLELFKETMDCHHIIL